MPNSIYAPFPLAFHLTFCIIATIFYSIMYVKKGYLYHFFLILAIDLTLLTQFFPTRKTVTILGIAEAILLTLIVISYTYNMHKLKEIERKRTAVKYERYSDDTNK